MSTSPVTPKDRIRRVRRTVVVGATVSFLALWGVVVGIGGTASKGAAPAAAATTAATTAPSATPTAAPTGSGATSSSAGSSSENAPSDQSLPGVETSQS